TIQRLDTHTGETERYVTGPGGAIRPTPSPDGKSLAFVRRVRFQSQLFVMDLASGETRVVHDELERDMQEAWAIHGVYPAMAWTPDSASIVFWAGGKVRRVDVASGEARVIPFRVRTEHEITEALRFEHEVAPDEFDVKMLRWAQVSPSGDRVVYQALGHLYVRALPEGEPRRLTSQTEHFEHYPSFSRDGRWIVYTTWNDETLGGVRIVSAEGGPSRVLTADPGHYLEPAFSPDGKTVVYRKATGGWLRSPAWSRDPGLYSVRVDGGEPMRIATRGARPHFGAENDRVYFLHVEGDETTDTRTLRSVDVRGAEERTHVSTTWASDFRVSPDGRWVAWTEGFNAFVAPFVRAGQTVTLGPKTNSVPVRRVSRDAGEFLHWSGDSTALHWTTGPELFTRALTDTFAFLDGAPDELPEPPTEGVNISFRAAADAPEGVVALVGARIVTMKGDEVIENGAVVVERNRIVAVGPRARVEIPRGAHVIDVEGRTIMPGIIDIHAHGAQGSDGIIPQRNWLDYASIAFGTTTIHDPSNDTHTIFAAAEMTRAGKIIGPRIYSTGTILYGAAGWFRAEIESREDAVRHLRRLKSMGAISVKSYNQPRREQRQWVIDAGRELEMMIMPEGGSLFMHNMTMILDGHTGVEHNIPVERAYKDVISLWGASKTGNTPTLVVCFGGMSGENYWYQHDDVYADERLLRFVPRSIVDPRARRRTMAPEEEYNHIRAAAVCKALQDAGVTIHVGAHGQMAGLAAHWEMWMFAQGGMSPMQVIRAATIDGARYIGMDKDIGSIEVGKLADLLVLDKCPLEDIRNSRHIEYTMINGRIYNARTMDQVGNHPDDHGSRWFGDNVEGVGFGRWWREHASPTKEDAYTGCVSCTHTTHRH
ncbi:MAG: amidohydrolase, partial [Phycisphaerales bacterium]